MSKYGIIIINHNNKNLLKMIDNRSSAIVFGKPKHAKSLKWDSYLQIYVNGSPQHFTSCIDCH
jgi:hypothetical protein